MKSMLVATSLAAALVTATQAQTEAAKPLAIPAAHFANANGLVRPLLSPDGSRYAGMVRADARRALVSRKLDGSETRVAFALDQPDFELQLLRWLGNERLLLRLTNYKPGPVYGMRLPVSGLLAINLDGSKAEVLYDEGLGAWTNHSSSEVDQACPAPGQVLLVRAGGDDFHGVDQVDAQTGKAREASASLRGVGNRWWADAKGQVRLALRITRDGQREILLRQPLPEAPQRLGNWQTWKQLSAEQAEGLSLLGFDADPQRLIVQTRLPDGGSALQRWALDGSAEAETLLALKPGERMDSLLRNEADCRAVGARGPSGQRVWGDGLGALIEGIAAALPGADVELLQWQGDRYLASTSAVDRPFDSLVGQRKAGTLASVAWSYTRLPEQLGVKSQRLASGAELLRPSDAPAAKALPLLICLQCELHRGDEGGFEPLRALLLHRGYAVLLPKLKSEAQTLERMTEQQGRQLELQLQQALQQPGLDAQRIGLIASDSAAYLGLRWAQQRETALRAVVVRGALSNLVRYKRGARKEEISAGYRAAVMRLLGDLDQAGLEAASPSYQAARLRAPTLILHGDHDARTAFEHAKDLKTGLEKAATAVQLIGFAHSDSDLDHPPYRREAFEAIEAWLAKYL